jgi:hypothetical protein
MSDNLSGITETDPKKLFVEIAKKYRPVVKGQAYSPQEDMAARKYYTILSHAADTLGVPFIETQDISETGRLPRIIEMIDSDIATKELDILLESVRQKETILMLDTAWRDKIHSYVAHIRSLVTGASDLSPQLRETILKRLNAFAAELDRGRTRIQAFTDIFVGLCEGVSRGAVALTPAVKLGERIIGALARLGGEKPVLLLPPPEQFDLPDELPAEDSATPV